MFQLVQRQELRWSASDRIDPQWLPELVHIRQDVKSGKLDLNAITNRLVKLSQRVVGADGAGVWLFTHDDVFLCTGAGNAPNDERLRLVVISKLADVCRLSSASVPRLARPTAISTRDNASDPSGTTSLLVEPIYQGHYIAGALAAFSDKLNSFTEQDANNFHLLAGVLTQALSKATGARLEQSVALDPAAMLQLIERIIPTLQRMLESEENARPSAHRFSKSAYQLPAADLDKKPLQELHRPGEETSAAEAPGGIWTEHEQGPPASPVDSATCPALEGTNVPRIEVPGPFATEGVETSTDWPTVRQKSERVVAAVGKYASLILNALEVAGSWFLNRFEKTEHRVLPAAHFDPAQLPGKAAFSGLQRLNASISSAVKSARNSLRAATAHRPNLPTVRLKVRLPALPKVVWRRDSFKHALKSANNHLALCWAAPLVAILVFTITFLMVKTGLHNLAQTTASSSQTTEREQTIPLSAEKADAREAQAAEQFETSAPLQVSHMHVTDRVTEQVVRTLSHYELVGLRRRAHYGDDSAAFQMGMAYEIGRELPQSCTTAAQWVATAASEGNVAAQYNLGLRYRDGDGVPVNEVEAVKWLQKAAAQQGSAAQVAMGVLTAYQARVIPSPPTSH
ncbi:MAG TPA: hypothetical protein VEI01_07200 [Terriglobales bacterium]|nr:hypothetical protein [Terriglobales bacterium]